MGIVTPNGISGSVGSIVYSNYKGKTYVSAKPGPRNKKKGKSKNPLNTIFGTTSTYGTRMIKHTSSSFLFRFGRETYNDGRGWIRDHYAAFKDEAIWELSAKSNSMCQLNEETDLRDFLGVNITVTNDSGGIISVQIPEIKPKKDLKAPPGTMKVNLKMVAVTSPFRVAGIPNNYCMEQFDFNYSDIIIPAKETILDTKASAGDIAMVMIALEFETANPGKGLYNIEKRWLPAAIIAIGRLKA